MRHWIDSDRVRIVPRSNTRNYLTRRCVNQEEHWRAWCCCTTSPVDSGKSIRREPARGKIVSICRRVVGDLVTPTGIEHSANGAIRTIENLEGE
jgi:hypothetical protein